MSVSYFQTLYRIKACLFVYNLLISYRPEIANIHNFQQQNILEMSQQQKYSHQINPENQKYQPNQRLNGQQSILNCSALAKLSLSVENMENNNNGFNFCLISVQSIIDFIIPSLLSLLSLNIYGGEFQNRILTSILSVLDIRSYEISNTTYILVQFWFLILLTTAFTSCFYFKFEKIKIYTIRALIIFYFCSGLFLIVQANFLYYSLQTNTIGDWNKVITVINIWLGIVLIILYKILSQSYSLNAPNLLVGRFTVREIACTAISKIILVVLFLAIVGCYFNIDQKNSPTMILICNVPLLLMNLFKLYHEFVSYTYPNDFTEKVYRNYLTLQFSCISITLLCLITRERLLIENYYYTVTCLYFFLHLTFNRLITRKCLSYKWKKPSQIKTSNQACEFIRQLNRLFQIKYMKNATSFELQMINNIYTNHEDSCLDVSCFCKGVDRNTKNILQMVPFYKLLALKVMEDLCQRIDENGHEVQKLVLQAKLSFYNNFLGTFSLQNLKQKESQKQLEFWSKYFTQKYKLKVHKILQDKNRSLKTKQIERIIESDSLTNKIFVKITEIINRKKIFWGSLAKGNINEQLDNHILDQLKLIKLIQGYTEIAVGIFSNCAFLISLLISYESHVLLKQKISKQLVSCIIKSKSIQSKTNFKHYQIKKQPSLIERIMYSNSACSIEISTQPQKLGMIISLSRNAKDIFKYKDKALIGQNINKIMPQKMHKEHNRLLQNWTTTCSWANMGKVKQAYCIDSAKVCLAGRIYLKPIQRLNRVNLMGLFYKQNDQDYLIFDDQNLVVGAGSNCMQALGRNIINFSLSIICQEPQVVQLWAKNNNDRQHTMNFYPMIFYSHLLDEYNGLKGSADPELKKSFNNKINWLKKNQFQKISLVFSVGQFRFGKITFKYIKLCEVPAINRKHSFKNLGNTKTNFLDILKFQSIKIKNTNSLKQKQQNIFLGYTSSVSSSKEQQTTSTINTLNKLQKLFYQGQKIKDKRVVKIVIIILLLCLVSILMGIAKITINQKGYKQISQFLEASSTSSENFQITLVLFNKILTIHNKLDIAVENYKKFPQNAPNLSESLQFQASFNELFYEHNFLKSLLEQQIFKYDKIRSSFTKISLFYYHNILVQWRDASGEQIQITTFNFLNNFLYLISDIEHQTQMILEKISKKDDIQQIMSLHSNIISHIHILQNNFQNLQKINKINLDYYQNLQISSTSQLQLYGYIKIAITILSILIILILLNFYIMFRIDQHQKISQIYQYITLELATELMGYFMKLNKMLKVYQEKQVNKTSRQIDTNKIIMNIHEEHEKYLDTLPIKQKQSQKSPRLKLYIQKQSCQRERIFLIGIFIILLSLNILMERSQFQIMTKSQQIVKLLNNLIQQQNLMISPYLFTRSENKFSQQIALGLLQNKEIKFTEIILSSFNLLESFDPDYQQQMIKLLTRNVCQLTKNQFTNQQYKQCLQKSEMKIIRFGVINGINYFNRQFLKYLAEQYFNKSQHMQVSTSLSLVEVDESLFQMEKVFHFIHELIIDSLKTKLNSQKIQLIFYISAELVIFLAIGLYIVRFRSVENRKSSDRVGRILLLPVRILKNQPKILQNFETAIDYFSLRMQ